MNKMSNLPQNSRKIRGILHMSSCQHLRIRRISVLVYAPMKNTMSKWLAIIQRLHNQKVSWFPKEIVFDSVKVSLGQFCYWLTLKQTKILKKNPNKIWYSNHRCWHICTQHRYILPFLNSKYLTKNE